MPISPSIFVGTIPADVSTLQAMVAAQDARISLLEANAAILDGQIAAIDGTVALQAAQISSQAASIQQLIFSTQAAAMKLHTTAVYAVTNAWTKVPIQIQTASTNAAIIDAVGGTTNQITIGENRIILFSADAEFKNVNLGEQTAQFRLRDLAGNVVWVSNSIDLARRQSASIPSATQVSATIPIQITAAPVSFTIDVISSAASAVTLSELQFIAYAG